MSVKLSILLLICNKTVRLDIGVVCYTLIIKRLGITLIKIIIKAVTYEYYKSKN